MAHQHWWTKTLATDNYRSLCEQESRLRPFLARSPQLCLRRCLSDWIATLGQQLHLRSITRHLAVLMLDLFMDRHDIPPTKLLPTALGCLVIACKFEEHEENIPRRKNLAEVLNLCLPGVSVEILLGGDVMLQTEMQVLAGLSWNLFLPTAAHFSDYFLTLALHEVSFPSQQGCDKQLYLRRYTSYFLELSLQDHVHLNFPPSLVAASCVSAARMCVHLPPTWPGQLQQLIGYNLQQLLPCMELLIRAYKSDRDANKQRKEQLLELSQPEIFTPSCGKCTCVESYPQNVGRADGRCRGDPNGHNLCRPPLPSDPRIQHLGTSKALGPKIG